MVYYNYSDNEIVLYCKTESANRRQTVSWRDRSPAEPSNYMLEMNLQVECPAVARQERKRRRNKIER